MNSFLQIICHCLCPRSAFRSRGHWSEEDAKTAESRLEKLGKFLNTLYNLDAKHLSTYGSSISIVQEEQSCLARRLIRWSKILLRSLVLIVSSTRSQEVIMHPTSHCLTALKNFPNCGTSSSLRRSTGTKPERWLPTAYARGYSKFPPRRSGSKAQWSPFS